MWVSVSCVWLSMNMWPNEDLGRKSIKLNMTGAARAGLTRDSQPLGMYWGPWGGPTASPIQSLREPNGLDPGDQEQVITTCSEFKVPLSHQQKEQIFHARCWSKRLWLDLGETYMRMKVREQNKKPKDIDLVMVISPISYHMCHI